MPDTRIRKASEWESKIKPEFPCKKPKYIINQLLLEECPLDNITVKNSPVRKQEIEFDIGYQVAKGIVEPIELEAEALVLSQGWPSFTFALEGLGFSKVSTVASFPSLTSRDEFRSTSMGKTIMDKKLLDSWLETNSDSGVIFVQGEKSFLEVAFRKLEN